MGDGVAYRPAIARLALLLGSIDGAFYRELLEGNVRNREDEDMLLVEAKILRRRKLELLRAARDAAGVLYNSAVRREEMGWESGAYLSRDGRQGEFPRGVDHHDGADAPVVRLFERDEAAAARHLQDRGRSLSRGDREHAPPHERDRDTSVLRSEERLNERALGGTGARKRDAIVRNFFSEIPLELNKTSFVVDHKKPPLLTLQPDLT